MKTFKALFIFLIILNACQSKNGSISELKNDDQNAPKIDQTDTIPFSIKKYRILVHPSIEGNSTIPLILDNGVPQTIIDETYLPKIKGQHTIDTICGMDFPAYKIFPNFKVQFNSYTFNIDTIKITNCKLFDPNIEYGILGYDFFKNKIVRLSFEDSIIIVSNNLPDTIGYERFKLYDIPKQSVKYFHFKFYKNNNYKEANIGIDLGSQFSDFKKELILELNDSIENSIHTKSIFSNILYKAIVKNKNDLLASSLPNSFYSNFDGLLGIAFLKKFDIIIDDINMNIYIKPINTQNNHK